MEDVETGAGYSKFQLEEIPMALLRSKRCQVLFFCEAEHYQNTQMMTTVKTQLSETGSKNTLNESSKLNGQSASLPSTLSYCL